MSKLLHIKSRTINRPLLLEPAYAGVFLSAISGKLGISEINAFGQMMGGAEMANAIGEYEVSEGSDSYQQGGIAVIGIDGTLVHKSGYIGTKSGLMGYDGIAAQLNSAINSPEIAGIMLDINSCGGEVSGVQSLASLIANSPKPVWAHANEKAASAAYWIASAADKVIVTQTSEVGSVGVVLAHTDSSKAHADAGLKVTLIHAGSHKVDGNPYEPLPESVRGELQAELNDLRLIFAADVAQGRGISTEHVLSTEAQMYRGQAAVDIGFADQVMTFDAALSAFSKTLATSNGEPRKGLSMSKPLNPAGDGEQTITMQAHELALNAAVAEALKAGATQERERITAVLNSNEAEGRELTAKTLALTTDMNAEQASAVLASIAKPSATSDLVTATLGKLSQADIVDPAHVPALAGKITTVAERLAATGHLQLVK